MYTVVLYERDMEKRCDKIHITFNNSFNIIFLRYTLQKKQLEQLIRSVYNL